MIRAPFTLPSLPELLQRHLSRSPAGAAWISGTLATFSFLLWQGRPYLFDWDELIYGSLARHMVLTGHWWELAINGVPFWEKPPLFFWLQAIAFSLFGIGEASARLPNALVGGGTIALCVWMGYRLQGPLLGWLWGLWLGTGWLPLVFAKTGLIDPVFNLCMLVGLGGWFLFDRARLQGRSGRKALLFSGMVLGLAVLAKGPLGLGLPMTIWLVYKLWHRRPWPNLWDWGLFFAVSFAVALSWFGLEIWIQGPEFLTHFVEYQWRILRTSDGHPGPIYFHLLVYSLGCFPYAALSLVEIWNHLKGGLHVFQDQTDLRRFSHLMLVAFGIVLGLFSLVVQTKLAHYTSLLYPIGAYFAALRSRSWVRGDASPTGIETFWIVVSGVLWCATLLVLPWIGQHPQAILAHTEDLLTKGYLSAPVVWPWITYGPGVVLLVGIGAWVGSYRWASPCGLMVRWGTLALFTWLSGQLFWAEIAPRILEHTQGGAVAIFQRVDPERSSRDDQKREQAPAPIALYGFRSFIPYFYGPPQVLYSDMIWPVIPWVENGHVQYVLTWLPWQDDLTQQLPLVPIEVSGAFVLLQAQEGELPG